MARTKPRTIISNSNGRMVKVTERKTPIQELFKRKQRTLKEKLEFSEDRVQFYWRKWQDAEERIQEILNEN